MRLRAIVTLALFLGFCLVTQAQDACIALLNSGIYDTISSSTSQSSNQQVRAKFCSWYSSYRTQNSGASANATIPIADIPIGIGGSYTYGSADALSQAVCQDNSSLANSNNVFTNAARYIDPNAAAAFSACVTAEQHGIRAQALISDDNTLFNIDLSYSPPEGQQNGATVTSVQMLPPDAFDCPTPMNGGTDVRSLVGQNGALKNVNVSLTCQRKVLNPPQMIGTVLTSAESGIVAIHTSAGSFTQFFPAIPAPNPLTDTQKIMAALPVGTILVWDRPLSDIPQGWHLCDGTNGTVNLIDRIPMGIPTIGEPAGGPPSGSPDDTALGRANEGALTHTHSFTHGQATDKESQGGVRQDPHPGGGQWVGSAGHTHPLSGVVTDSASSLPPVTRVIFIQKLATP